jgi:DNA-binding CsgD family transcriptional regulator
LLTPREREVLELMAQGYESIQIAAHLGITQRAVEDHRHRMYAKVGQHNAIMVLREFYDFLPKQNLKQSEVHHGKAEERTQTETRTEAQTRTAGRRISKLSFHAACPQREMKGSRSTVSGSREIGRANNVPGAGKPSHAGAARPKNSEEIHG